jgi:hypothetical protein
LRIENALLNPKITTEAVGAEEETAQAVVLPQDEEATVPDPLQTEEREVHRP